MRLCRYSLDGEEPSLGFYFDDHVIPVAAAHQALCYGMYGGLPLLPNPDDFDILDYLPPNNTRFAQLQRLYELAQEAEEDERISIPTEMLYLELPVPMPKKVLCIAGNYAEHVREGGGKPVDKSKTFPFFFMKPPTTTLRPAQRPVVLPEFSPDHIDWELELTIIVGDYMKNVTPEQARAGIAGYTIGLDMSNRSLRLNPDREQQERTWFFEWLAGKWHDGFAPIGPCLVPNDGVFDPTKQNLKLEVSGKIMQKGSTADMVFDVYEVVSFASKVLTLEPGDLIMTGTPAGVGAAKGRFLESGDTISGTISGIGTLDTFVV